MDATDDKCKQKWRNLRDSFLKSIKWKRQLEMLNKLENFCPYKHEEALSFLLPYIINTGKRRNTSDGDSSSSKSRRQHIGGFTFKETYEAQAETVEYLVEADSEEEQSDDNCKFVIDSMQETAIDHEDPTAQLGNFNENHQDIIYEEQIACKQEDGMNDEEDLNHNEPLQSDYGLINNINKQKEPSASVNDPFFVNICETISSLPKLTQARLKKQIYDLVSEAEINYLESVENSERN